MGEKYPLVFFSPQELTDYQSQLCEKLGFYQLFPNLFEYKEC